MDDSEHGKVKAVPGWCVNCASLERALAEAREQAERFRRDFQTVQKLLDDALARERKGLVPLVTERDAALALLRDVIAEATDPVRHSQAYGGNCGFRFSNPTQAGIDRLLAGKDGQ